MGHSGRGNDSRAIHFDSKMPRFWLRLRCFTPGFGLCAGTIFLVLFLTLTLAGCGHRPRPPVVLAGEKHLVVARDREPLMVVETRDGTLAREISRPGGAKSTQVIYDRVLYQGSNNCTVTGRDITQGSKSFTLWQCSEKKASSDSSNGSSDESSSERIEVVSVDEFRVYAQGSEGKFWAIDKSTGETLWMTTKVPGIDHIRVVGDAVYASSKRVLHKIDGRTGKHEWEFTFRDAVGPVYVTDARVYVMSVRGEVRALDESNGDVIWKYNAPEKACNPKMPLVFVDKDIVVGCFADETIGISVQRKSHVWKSDGETLGLIDGIVAVQSNDDTVVGLDVQTGQTKWTIRLATDVMPYGIVRDHRMYVSDRRDNVYGIDTTTGKLVLRYRWPSE